MEVTGLHHIIITISDIARSRAFYGDFLGFALIEVPNGFFFNCGGLLLFFYLPAQPVPNDRFNEFRIGLDHLAFTVSSEEALHAMVSKLRAAGLETQGVEQFHTGNLYVVFRDPDNIQLEYWLPK